MQSFLTQLMNILSTNPGILVYHTVVAFSIAAALPVAIYQWRTTGLPQGRRTVVGLSLLLLTRLALFLIAGLASQAVLLREVLLQIQPALDRGIALIGLILIAWLWAFPDPVRMGDAAAALLAMLTVLVSIFGLVWWTGQGTGLPFNGSWPDFIGEIYALLLIAIGLLALLLRRPEGWGTGLVMLLVLGLGHSANLIFPLADKDYQVAVRLAEMVAFSLLLTLPLRFTPRAGLGQGGDEALGAVLFGSDPQLLRSFLLLATEGGTEQALPGVCKLAAQRLQAELCLIAAPGEGSDRLVIEGGFHLGKETEIKQGLLEGNLAGVISNALRRNRPLRLPLSSVSSDFRALSQALETERAGHLLAVPLPRVDNRPALGIVALSSPAASAWTTEDQANLASLAEPLARILHQVYAVSSLQQNVVQANGQVQTVQGKIEQIQLENEHLLAQLEEVRQHSIQEHSRAESLAALIASQEGAQETIGMLETEIKSLRETVAQEEGTHIGELQHLKGELTRALDEVALLQARLSAAAQPPRAVRAGAAESQTARLEPAGLNEQAEIIASIAQELRQPMSSIVGYTDLLLGESVGILGALQRKFLERVKASTERMNGLLDDLIHTISLGKGELELKPELVDLNLVLDEAIALTITQIREKSILLRVDLPDQLPPIMADRDALQQILINLLQNAGLATPLDGEISISATAYSGVREAQAGAGEQDYILLRVSDSGGGIPPEDLPRVFSRLYRADNALIQGVGDTGVGLSIVKTLIEAHGGRIWVDTEVGRGSTFSILLPVSASRLRETVQKGVS